MFHFPSLRRTGVAAVLLVALPAAAKGQPAPRFHDTHFHFTDYIQRETPGALLAELLGDTVGRAALMGIPLQQKWDYAESGDRAPDYYLRSDAALYYYSFVDAAVAMAVTALPAEVRDRLDPMITGFNPTDMYAVDHIRRVLRLFPGVFTGIGEFSVHKEVVSPKTLGHTASLRNPALGRILDFAAETGMIVMIHCDADVMLPRPGEPPVHLDPLADLLRRHPGATVLWAHAGIGRFVEPVSDHPRLLEGLLRDPSLSHVHLELSWDVVAEHVVAPPERLAQWAALVDRWPERFLLGSDAVIPAEQADYLAAFEVWAPLLDRLGAETSRRVRTENYERLFDAARSRVRAWERSRDAR